MTGLATPEGLDAAQAAADRIATQIWASREGFVYESEPLQASLQRALALAAESNHADQRPVLLLDHSDNCMSGGTCDTMDVIAEACVPLPS